MMQERLLAFLQRDGVHQRLALHAFQARLDDLPFGRVDHDRNAGNVGLGGDEVEVFDHRLLGVDEALVHVDVDDLRAVFDLVAGDIERCGVIACGDQLAELGGARDVRPLADIDEGDVLRQREGLEAGEAHQRRTGISRGLCLARGTGFGNRLDMFGASSRSSRRRC